jgi:uncharacterized protein
MAARPVSRTELLATRLWQILAHYHGQLWNASEIGRAVDTTIRRHLDILTGALVVRQLQ